MPASLICAQRLGDARSVEDLEEQCIGDGIGAEGRPDQSACTGDGAFGAGMNGALRPLGHREDAQQVQGISA